MRHSSTTEQSTTPPTRGARNARRRASRVGGAALLFALLALACVGPGVAGALPADRVYEMVSPVFKGGFGVSFPTEAPVVALDGESVAYHSSGAFAGAPAGSPLGLDYLARRGASGWSTVSLLPPAALAAELREVQLSPTLGSVLWYAKLGPNAEHANIAGTRYEFLSHSTSALASGEDWDGLQQPLTDLEETNFELPDYAPASPDFCRVFPLSNASALLPEAAGVTVEPYELDRGCRGTPVSLRLLAVNDAGSLINRSCGVAEVGDEFFAYSQSSSNAVSSDGEVVFFTDCLASKPAQVPGPALSHQLFVRLDGSRTLEVSKPLGEADSCARESVCATASARPSADFVGASEDGSRVYFTTSAALVGEDHDQSNDLYMATIGCPPGEAVCAVADRQVRSLVQVSHDPNGGQAGVQGVLRVAPDGSRVYFVAAGELLTAAQRQVLLAQGQPVPAVGADNLYVYDAGAESTVFIADLCSGPKSSGAVEDIHCPANLEAGGQHSDPVALWLEHATQAQTAGVNGRFLLFSSYGQLASGDTNATQDVYLYDAQTGVLRRVSLSEGGYDANGNGDASDAQITSTYRGGDEVQSQYGGAGRAVSEDGSRVVFESSAPLSPAATNGLINVYEWRAQPGGEGSVSLISSGSAEEPIEPESIVMSPSGSDIFFVTSQGLIPQDTDGLNDLYDARLDGGFPAVPAAAQPCSGDACQGPLTNPAAQLVPGSLTQTPGQNLPLAGSKTSVKQKQHSAKRKAGKKASSRRHMNRKRKRRSDQTGDGTGSRSSKGKEGR